MYAQLVDRTRRLLHPLVAKHPRLEAWLSRRAGALDAVRRSLATSFPSIAPLRTRNVTMAITARCNLRCHGCRYGRDFMPNRELPWPVVRDVLDDARACGVESIRLYGGEPLLHRDLPKMVEHAVRRGLSPYVTTNAVLLERRIDELFAAGLRFLTIGYYGTGDAYDQYVHRAGAYARIERSIAAVRERYGGAVRMRLNWLLMRPSCNLDALHEVWGFARRFDTPLQIDLIHYSLPYFTEGPDRELQFRAEDRPAIERVAAELIRLKGERPDLIEPALPAIRSIPDWLVLGPRMRVPCDKSDMIWIGADGTVQLCYVTYRLGNLHESRLRDLLFTDAHRAAARGACELTCPNCHCGYDSRIKKHAPSLRRYSDPDAWRAIGGSAQEVR